MRRHRYLHLIPLLVLASSSCRFRPEPIDEVVFAHGPHLADGATCIRCHAAAAEPSPIGGPSYPSASGRPLLPAEQDCRSCHDAPEDDCARCHTLPAAPATYAPADDDILFGHLQHTDVSEGRCVRCHGDPAAQSVETFSPRRPTMATCTDNCHVQDMRDLRCVTCHEDLHRYGIEEIAILDHESGFLRRHGLAARADAALCTQCHEPTYCEDCHLNAQGPPLEVFEPTLVHREFVHRGDFLARHGIEADLERGTCVRCHGVSFCDGCHQSAGIGGSVAPGSPHPPGWLDPLSAFGHARAARRDLLSCVSCHESDAEQTCVPCHRVGGVAGNPHPPGFGAGTDPMRHGVCRACHTP